MDIDFDEIKRVDDYYFAFSKKDKLVQVLNNDYKVIKMFLNDYVYV